MTYSIDNMAKEVMKLITSYLLKSATSPAISKQEKEKYASTPDAFDTRMNPGRRRNLVTEKSPSS